MKFKLAVQIYSNSKEAEFPEFPTVQNISNKGRFIVVNTQI